MNTQYLYHPPAASGHAPLKSWTRGVAVEEEAWAQLRNVAALPFIHSHVAAMPDVHWGRGATVGSVIATRGAIVPAAVGVDIGCGMMACRTDLAASDLPDTLVGLRTAIEAAVPHGRTHNGSANDRGAWGEPPASAVAALSAGKSLEPVLQRHERLRKPFARAVHHIGTLGTGNHFIEICLDEADRVWVMLHSGSRGVGNAIGMHFITLAKREMERWFVELPDADLAYLPENTPLFGDYMQAVGWAQDFALRNRSLMMANTMDALRQALGRPFNASVVAVNCHHNYVRQETHHGAEVWVTRKGAVRAGLGELGIIPGSMGARSFIVRGKGNADSFESCSHGAGRAMSRNEARRRFSLDDHAAATAHVECRKDADVLDETPAAYKPIDAVMAAQSDLVDIVHTLRQVVCVKG